MRYVPEFDGVRGIAVSAVLAFHVLPWTGGWLGVHIFFVLSGFLITTILVDEWRTHGVIKLRSFYARRALRLLPALIIALCGYLLLSLTANALDPGAIDVHERMVGVAAGAGYVSNILLAFGAQPIEGLSHLWSLAAEEQFYTLWPVALLVLLRRSRSFDQIRWLTLAAIVALSVHVLELLLTGVPPARIHFGPDTSAIPLLIGCYAALGGASFGRRRRLELVAGTTVVVVLLGAGASDRAYFPALALACVATAYLLPGLATGASALGRPLRAPALVWLGRISYGVYLWHLILIEATPWVPPAVGVVLAVPVAALSFRYIEQPARRFRERGTHRVALPAAAHS